MHADDAAKLRWTLFDNDMTPSFTNILSAPTPMPEKHYMFRVSSVKSRDLHLSSLFKFSFATWQD